MLFASHFVLNRLVRCKRKFEILKSVVLTLKIKLKEQSV